MNDKNVLQHLLDLEKQTSALVDEAQAEADRKLSEGEKLSRAKSDEAYAREFSALEEKYKKDLNDVKTNYRQQLDNYRESIEAQTLNRGAFSRLAQEFLLGAAASSRGS